MSRVKEGEDYIGFEVEYKSRGFTVFVDRHEGLAKFQSHDGRPVILGFKAFSGRTSEGIALGSTRQQVERIYGTPKRIRKLDEKSVLLNYDVLGLWFLIDDGTVTYIEATRLAGRDTKDLTKPEPPR